MLKCGEHPTGTQGTAFAYKEPMTVYHPFDPHIKLVFSETHVQQMEDPDDLPILEIAMQGACEQMDPETDSRAELEGAQSDAAESLGGRTLMSETFANQFRLQGRHQGELKEFLSRVTAKPQSFQEKLKRRRDDREPGAPAKPQSFCMDLPRQMPGAAKAEDAPLETVKQTSEDGDDARSEFYFYLWQSLNSVRGVSRTESRCSDSSGLSCLVGVDTTLYSPKLF